MFVLVILNIIIFEFVAANLKIESVVMKSIRIGDIGLNFDMSISNLNSKVTYTFKVVCEKCCVFLQGNETECSSKIVGGSFGDIYPGKSKVVTLLWPNLVIFNRIGYCDVAVTTTRAYTDKVRLPWRIEFNTTYDLQSNSKANKIFDYISNAVNISKCSSPDLNPVDSCSPINCEAKYMGKRNYYNPTAQLCQPVPECSHNQEEIYDYIQNECVVLSKILTQSDLEKLKSGEFEKYDWEPSLVNSPFLDSYEYPEALLEEEALIKSKVVYTKYALYFTFLNCAIVLFISCIFYCLIALMISLALGISGRKNENNTQRRK